MSLSPETATIYDPEQYSEDELRAYQARVLAEIASELESNDHLAQAGVEVVCFTSLSAGRGRRRRTPREVILVKFAGTVHQFDRERYPAYRGADSHAQEVFADHGENGHDPYDLYFDAVLGAISAR